MIPDIESVIETIRETAAKEIMPRFRTLTKDDITEKKPGDLVTTADIEAEKRLESLLKGLVPGSVVVGEEGAEADPKRLQALSGSAPVWVIDPVDGTFNFAHGKPCFATIIAYCVDGETLAGWIHDPVADVTVWSASGEGAWMGEGAKPGNNRLRVAEPVAVSRLNGSLGSRLRRRLERRRQAGEGGIPNSTQYHCVGREYMDLGRGELDYAHYARRLKPWDHAAGVLIHREAGGFSALTADGHPYHPAKSGDYSDQALLLAPDGETWEALRNLLSGEQ